MDGSAMDWTDRQIGWAQQLNGMGQLVNRQWTARNGLDGSRWDGLDGQLGVAWDALGNGWLGVTRWMAMDGLRDGSAIGNGWLAINWTARDGTSSAMDGSALRDELDGSRWDGSAIDGSASHDGLDGL